MRFLSYYSLAFNPFDKHLVKGKDCFESDDIKTMLSMLDYLKDKRGIGAAGGYIVDAGELGTIKDQRRMEQMVTQLTAMFAGGEIDEGSKDAAMAALNDAYWKHKQENRERFTTNANKEKKKAKAEKAKAEAEQKMNDEHKTEAEQKAEAEQKKKDE